MPNAEQTAAVVATHWCQLLDVTDVSDNDDFFELGGNSMLALLLAERVEEKLGVEFPLDDLFLEGTFGAVVAACVAPADSNATVIGDPR